MMQLFLQVTFSVADILDRVSAKFCELEVDYDCLGGGRIEHKKDEKSILVYGYSMVSERAILTMVYLLYSQHNRALVERTIV